MPLLLFLVTATEFRNEWQHLYTRTNFYRAYDMVLYVKNHIAASVKFAEIQTINGEDYRSAQLLKELGPEGLKRWSQTLVM